MNKKNLTVAVITAREGSKGVVDKNLCLVGEISLVGLAISSAINSRLFDKVILSTDGERIAQEGRLHGAEIVLRPKELASDGSKSIDAVLHAIDQTNCKYGTVVLLQPTSPFRSEKHILESLSKFRKNKAMSLVSVCEADHHPYKTFFKKDFGFEAVKDIAFLDMPRQEMPKAFRLNGALFINDIEKLRESRSFYSLPLEIYEMDTYSSIDIDSELDLKIANLLHKES